MESKYLLEISDTQYSCRYGKAPGAQERAEAASKRLYDKCQEQRPFVSIHIKNPRYSAE